MPSGPTGTLSRGCSDRRPRCLLPRSGRCLHRVGLAPIDRLQQVLSRSSTGMAWRTTSLLVLAQLGQGAPQGLGVAGPEVVEERSPLGAQPDQAGPTVVRDRAPARSGCRSARLSMTRLMVAAVVPSSSASEPRRTGPACSIRDRAEDWDGVMSEPDRVRSWRWMRTRATRRPEASSTAPTCWFLADASSAPFSLVPPLVRHPVYLVTHNYLSALPRRPGPGAAAGRAGSMQETACPIVESKNYKWVALTNTTIGILMVTINASILLIALPDIFRGIGLNPLAPGNTSYFLWILMGFLLVTSVLVVSFGRVGDIFGRVRMYTLGFAIFTVFSDPPLGHLDERARRRPVDHHHAGRPGGRRGLHLRQLHGHHHRRLPGR